MAKIHPKQDFCVKITPENLEIMQKWWESIGEKVKDRTWTKGAYYGWKNGSTYAQTHFKEDAPPTLSIEGFKKIILEQDIVINSYPIY